MNIMDKRVEAYRAAHDGKWIELGRSFEANDITWEELNNLSIQAGLIAADKVKNPDTLGKLIGDVSEFPEWLEPKRLSKYEVIDRVLELSEFWISGALNCKSWCWDGDQREAAEYGIVEIKLLRYFIQQCIAADAVLAESEGA